MGSERGQKGVSLGSVFSGADRPNRWPGRGLAGLGCAELFFRVDLAPAVAWEVNDVRRRPRRSSHDHRTIIACRMTSKNCFAEPALTLTMKFLLCLALLDGLSGHPVRAKPVAARMPEPGETIEWAFGAAVLPTGGTRQ